MNLDERIDNFLNNQIGKTEEVMTDNLKVFIKQLIEEETRKARIDELKHLYIGTASYMVNEYDDIEISERIKELENK